jgi:ATP-binding cassette, subfamily B, bacterial PglK
LNALLQIWHLLDRRQRRRFALLQLVSLLMALSTLGGIAALMPFLMVLVDPGLIEHSAALRYAYELFGFSSRAAFLAALAAAFLGVVLLASLVNLFGTLAMTRFAHEVGDGFHAALLGEYLRRDCAFHQQAGAAALFNKVVYSVNRVASGLIESAMMLITNVVTILAIAASIFVVKPWAALIAVAWFGGTYLLVYWLARRRLYRNGLLEAGLIATRARYANESLAAIREVQVLGRQGYFQNGFAAACRAISRVVATNQAIASAPRHALEFITVAALVGSVLLLSGGRVAGSWLAELAFLGFAAFRMLPAIQLVFGAVVRIRANQAMFDDVNADLAAALQPGAETGGEDEERWNGTPRADLRFEDLWFRYSPQDPAALAGVSLRIPAGKLVAFTGPNGCGKTTLMECALGLLQPERGQVIVDGITLDARHRAAWQRQLAYAPQRVVALDATLAENIALGVPVAEIDPRRLAHAVRGAHLESLVSTLPLGLRTPVGENGVRLSGGQRQRLGIARALYRDATLLVLDEPTAALDGMTEREFVEVLRAMRGGRTILLVTHRMSVARECDLVVAMRGGRIEGCSTGEELAELSSAHAEES